MPATDRLVQPRRCRAALLAGALLALAALTALVALPAPTASAAPGELDPSFGSGGSLRFFPSQEKIALRAVAVEPDDRIVLAGADATSESILVVRLLRNGELDPSFGSGGVVKTPFPGGINAVVIQPDGKIVIAGQAAIGATSSDFLAIRYGSSGALDPSFGGGDGIEIIPVSTVQDGAQGVSIGASGRILLTGYARLPKNADPQKEGVEAGVVVLQPNGKPDPSFDTDGVKTLTTTAVPVSDQGAAIVEQADGKIVVADETGNGAGSGFTIVRLLPGGGLDPEWGGTGVVNTPIPTAKNPGARGRSTDVLVQPDGRIVATGYGFDEDAKEKIDSKFAAVRYLADGKLDPSFGAEGSGIFTKQVSPNLDDTASWVARAPSGKLLLAGFYAAGAGLGDDSFAALRLDADGKLDPGYGAGGLALRGPTAPFGDTLEGAALDSRERVVVVSRAYLGGGATIVEVSRFLGDPGPDPPVPPEPPGPPGPPAPSTGPSSSGPTTASPPPPLSPPPPPHARMKAVPRKLAAPKLTGFAGTASDRGGKVAKVQIALVRLSATKAGRAATCQELKNARGRFKVVKAKRGNCPLFWLKAAGKAKWRFKLKTVLPPGRYIVYSRAVDASGAAETAFSRAAGNRYRFRLLAP